jgi:hypothetical protein
LTNVWFRDVCEDAISVLGTGDATIIGGGAQEASDKVVQHNGAGTVTVSPPMSLQSTTYVPTGNLRNTANTFRRSKTSPSSTQANSTAPAATAPTTSPSPPATSSSRTSAPSA